MSNLQLSHYENQLILYSKGHFQVTDVYEDLKTITANAYGLPLEFTEQKNVYHLVATTFFKLLEAGYIKSSMKDFMFSLFKYSSDSINGVEMMKKMIGEVSLIEVEGIDIGVADTSILPKRKKPIFEIRIVRFKDEDDSFILYGEQDKVVSYMKHIYKIQAEDVASESPTEYDTSDKMYADLEVVREENSLLEVFDADLYVMN